MESLLIMCMIATAAAAAATFLVIAHRLWMVKTRITRLPSGTMGWPLLGETLEFIFHAYSPRPETFMDKRRLIYGKVFKSHLFGNPTIISTDAEINKFVLQGDMTVFVPSYPRSVTELMGKSSILLINGSLQRKIHGLIASFFKSHVLKSQITAEMHKYVEMSMGCWKNEQVIYIQDVAKRMTFQVLVKGLVSMEPDGKEGELLKLQFQEFIAGLMSLPVKIPGSRLYRSLQAKKKMVQLMKKVIRNRRKMKGKKSYECNNNPSVADLIDVFVNDGCNELTDDLIADNLIDLMIPGEDSVPVLITLAVKYLSDCPPALCQMEEENMQLKKMKAEAGNKLQWEDYISLSFTQNVISETLRMGNVITGIMRKAMRDIEINGYFIPKGWCVLTYFRSVHLDDDFYEEPYKFNPWRWLKKEKDTSTCNFTPFGGGQRLCPGLDLARLEASIFLHHLLTSFRWVAEDDTFVSFPTVRMKKRMPIKVERKEVL